MHALDDQQDLRTDPRVRDWMSKSKVRMTRARLGVARLLLLQSQPPSAELLFRLLVDRGEEISLGSVYRILKQMEEEGLVRREWQTSALGSKAVYAIHGDARRKRAYVLRCTGCGRQQRVNDAALASQLANVAHLEGFQLPADIAIPALCHDCAVPARPDGAS